MNGAILSLSKDTYGEIMNHLVRADSMLEEAAFAFAIPDPDRGDKFFRVIAWEPVGPGDFVYRSEINFELTDETRGRVIKRAHDMSASIVEFHSHTGEHTNAKFSYSDRSGFAEIVPHVWWRLKGKPYFAVVVTRNNFDGLGWLETANATERLAALDVAGEYLTPTGLSPLDLEDYGYTF